MGKEIKKDVEYVNGNCKPNSKIGFNERFKKYVHRFFKKEQEFVVEENCKLNFEVGKKGFCKQGKQRGYHRNRRTIHPCKNFFEKNNTKEIMSLADMKDGDRVFVDFINGGRRITKHLYEIGIKKGDEIEILSNNLGQCVIMAGDKRLSLCWGVSKLIKVSQSDCVLQSKI